jgi:thymidine phosphorylase
VQASALLQMGGLARDAAAAEHLLERAWSSGAAAEKFARMVAALGGPHNLLERPWGHLPRAPVQRPALAARSGVISAIDVRLLGDVVVNLGGGRRHADAAIDHAVGLSQARGCGEAVQSGQPLAMVHARTPTMAEAAVAAVAAAFTIDDVPPRLPPLYEWLHEPDACPS